VMLMVVPGFLWWSDQHGSASNIAG